MFTQGLLVREARDAGDVSLHQPCWTPAATCTHLRYFANGRSGCQFLMTREICRFCTAVRHVLAVRHPLPPADGSGIDGESWMGPVRQ